MTRSNAAPIEISRLLLATVFLCLLLINPALAQESQTAPQPQPDAAPSEQFEEQTGRRLGDIPNDQIRQFRLRRACEQDLPECPPAIRAQLEQERKNRMYMSGMIIGIFVLVVLLMVRASQQKEKQNKKLAREFKNIGQRVKKYKGAPSPDEDEDDNAGGDSELKGGVR